jgi:aldehyde dehydrogenase family protein
MTTQLPGRQAPAPRAEPSPSRVATGRRQMDEMVARLKESASQFTRWTLRERVALARAMQAGMLRVSEPLVHAACQAKGISLGTTAEGEEWATGPWPVVRHLRLICESLTALEQAGNTPLGPVRRTAEGALAVEVFPSNRIDRMLFAGINVEVRLQPDMTEDRLEASRASFYKGRGHDGRTVLILGAGNLSAIAPMDVISKLFNEGKACLLKMHPVNDYLGPLLEDAFSEAIRRGVLAIAYGGPEEGAYLAGHPGIDEIHLTGSAQTYDQIVWGPPMEREGRKTRNDPLTVKPVTAELGNVSPVLVVPGPYRDVELGFQASSIAGAVAHNVSFNCNAPKMLVTPRGWSRREALLGGIERALSQAPVRRAYYPGAEERFRELTRGRQLRSVGDAGSGELPWTLVPGLDATDPREIAFLREPFCPILSETEVGSDDPIEFLERAVDFANNRLWGTLAADLVVHPRLLRDPPVAAAVERAIARLRYGVVTVNSWTGFVFSYSSPPWGGYPGSTSQNIQSGTGWVHNTPMLEGIEKAVLRHPITLKPKPATFPGHRTAPVLLRRLTTLEERASWRKVPGVVAAAMRG